MADGQVSQSGVMGIGAGGDSRVSQAGVFALANFPSESGRVSQAGLLGIRGGAQAQVSQAGMFVIGRGRVSDYRVRAWTYSMDGHDFYLLQVGEEETLVFDLATGQWMKWHSPDRVTWRAILGRNWTGIDRGALNLVGNRTNVVAGDDTYGVLWLLNPTQPYDEDPEDQTEKAFDRVATGGLPMRMRQTARSNEVYLLSVKGQEGLSVAAPVVTLETSDDAEQTWIDQGSVTIVAGEYDQEFAWRSLGLIQSPGRIFRITDNALARVDALDMR